MPSNRSAENDSALMQWEAETERMRQNPYANQETVIYRERVAADHRSSHGYPPAGTVPQPTPPPTENVTGETRMPVQMTAQTRTFGVEIETCIPERHAHLIRPGHHSKGPPVDSIPDGWEARTDSSIEPDYGYYPVELVSPILSGEAGLVSATYVTNWLTKLGAQPNRSTGLHVHIGAEDLSDDQVRAVKRAFVRYEAALLSLNGHDKRNRMSNSYCQLHTGWRRRELDQMDRYCSLNVSNWIGNRSYGGGKTTLECRLWQSTNDDTRVVAAISMFMALVQRAAELGARTEPHISSEREAVKTFIRNHFGRGIRSTDLRITPNASIADVMLRAYRESCYAARS